MCLNLDVPPSQGNETSGCRPCGCLFHTKRRLTNHYNTPPHDVSPRSVGTLSNQPADPQTVVCLMFYPPNTTRQASAVPVVAFHLKRRLTSHYNTLPTRDVPMIGRNLFKPASLPANRPTSLKLYPPVATRQAGAVPVVLFPHQETLEEPLQLTSTRHVLEVGLSFVKPTSQPAIQPACLMYYPPITTKRTRAVPVVAYLHQETSDEPLQHTPTQRCKWVPSLWSPFYTKSRHKWIRHKWSRHKWTCLKWRRHRRSPHEWIASILS